MWLLDWTAVTRLRCAHWPEEGAERERESCFCSADSESAGGGIMKKEWEGGKGEEGEEALLIILSPSSSPQRRKVYCFLPFDTARRTLFMQPPHRLPDAGWAAIQKLAGPSFVQSVKLKRSYVQTAQMAIQCCAEEIDCLVKQKLAPVLACDF